MRSLIIAAVAALAFASATDALASASTGGGGRKATRPALTAAQAGGADAGGGKIKAFQPPATPHSSARGNTAHKS